MQGYRKSSHATYRCEYHFVWIPKYRYQVLVKEIKSRLKEILIELCEWLDVDIMEGAIASDHVHMYVSVPPKYSPAHVMKILKGKSRSRPTWSNCRPSIFLFALKIAWKGSYHHLLNRLKVNIRRIYTNPTCKKYFKQSCSTSRLIKCGK